MTVEESYAWCRRLARSQARNFYYSFLLLSREKRRAMCAIYAFMRYCDDLSDAEGVGDRAAAIAKWEQDLRAALDGAPPDHPLWPAFADAVARFQIPRRYFLEMIKGVRSDLATRRIQTFEELYDYCYHVASVVGLTIIHIFGFRGEESLDLAEKCGIAFQLTNILRDVGEDAARGRVYLPAEDLQKFGVSPETFEPRAQFLELMAFEAGRARRYYRESAPLIERIDPSSRASLRALIGIYSRLLERIVESNYDVLKRRIRVPVWEKMRVLAAARWGVKRV
jgi:phytoene synthase